MFTSALKKPALSDEEVPDPNEAPLMSKLFPYHATAQMYVPGVAGAGAVRVTGTTLVVQPPAPPGQLLRASSFRFWSKRTTRTQSVL